MRGRSILCYVCLTVIILCSTAISKRLRDRPNSDKLYTETRKYLKELDKPPLDRSHGAQAFNSLVGMLLNLERCARVLMSDEAKSLLVLISDTCYIKIKERDESRGRSWSRMDTLACLSACDLEQLGLLDITFKPMKTKERLQASLEVMMPSKVDKDKLAHVLFKCAKTYRMGDYYCSSGLALHLCVVDALQQACNATLKMYS